MSCAVIELPNKRLWLVDCGAGTQQQMLKAGLWIGRVDKIFITHLHGDHCFDIVGLLALRGMRKVLSPIEVVGPVGIKELIETTSRLSKLYLPFQVSILELDEGVTKILGWRSQEAPLAPSSTPSSENIDEEPSENSSGSIASSSTTQSDSLSSAPTFSTSDDWYITAIPLDHRIACFGYIFNEKAQLGAFDSAIAIQKGVKGKQIGELASTGSVTLEGGVIISRSDCLKPSFAGRKIVILGDTHTCSAELREAAKCADVFVHEATFDAQSEEVALRSKHSTTHMAADCAIEAQVQQLIITHFSARYTDYGAEITVDHLLQETQDRAAGKVPVLAAKDFWSFEVPPKKAPAK